MKRAVAVGLACVLGGCPSGDDDYEFAVVIDDLPGAVLSFWGESATDLYAVGGDLGSPSQEMILRYDGQRWNRMQADAPTLWWVHGFAADDVWAVGEAGTVIHYDGTAWTTVRTGAPYTLWGIWGASSTDLWAVGGDVAHAVPSVLLHYDGADWTEVPEVARENDMFFKIWGASATDIWVVSERGIILHFDGDGWTETDPAIDSRLITVSGSGANDVWAVGGVVEPILLHYAGATWEQVPVDVPGGLMGVYAAPQGPVFVAGFSGVMALATDGQTFEEVPYLTPNCLHATWGDGNGVILAGGGNLLSGSNVRGIIVGAGGLSGELVDP